MATNVACGCFSFPVEVVSPVDTTSSCSTPLLLHTDTPICWHFGTLVDCWLVPHLTRRTPASWRGWHRTDRRRLTWTFLQQLPTVRLRQHHNVAFAALCSSDNGFWRQEWRYQGWPLTSTFQAWTKSTSWGEKSTPSGCIFDMLYVADVDRTLSQ